MKRTLKNLQKKNCILKSKNYDFIYALSRKKLILYALEIIVLFRFITYFERLNFKITIKSFIDNLSNRIFK